MNNLQDGDWDLADLKYTSVAEPLRKKFCLEKGDVLFNRTNSKELVGKCAVFRAEGRWYFASYLIRVRVADSTGIIPEFLARFLNSSIGRVQIDQASRQIIGMANINAEEIKNLLVPLPPPDVQRAHVADLDKHWAARQEKLARIVELLSAGSREIAERLGLSRPVVPAQLAYGARRGTMQAADRVNPEFFHPERIFSARAIEAGATPSLRLDAAAAFVRDRVSAPATGDFYVGLANVERDTGELRRSIQEAPPGGACVCFRAGDVLYAKLRPYLNKVHLAERPGVASPEFFVLRPRSVIRAEYLAAILRSEMVLAQTRHMTAGNTHPRLTTTDVHQLLLPVPDPAVQNEVAVAEGSSRAEARELKREADEAWSDAKRRFGDKLLT